MSMCVFAQQMLGPTASRRERIELASEMSTLTQRLVFFEAITESKVRPIAVGCVCARDSYVRVVGVDMAVMAGDAGGALRLVFAFGGV
jgi:hypothetical protein